MLEKEIEMQTLYETYFDDVYHYLLYFTNSQIEAEDLTQDTFIKVFKNYYRFQKQSSIKTWIFSIAKHVAIDYYRKRKMITLIPEILLNLGKSKEGIPDQHINKVEDWEFLQKALLKLKPEFRTVVILRGLKEFSVKETAEILNWKETKVKVDYHRAIKELKKYAQHVDRSEVFFNEKGIK